MDYMSHRAKKVKTKILHQHKQQEQEQQQQQQQTSTERIPMSCPVRLAFRDAEPETLFEPPALLVGMRQSLPRFGRAQELSDWMMERSTSNEDGDSSSSSDYLVGVMGSSIIVSVLLLLWAILLMMCATAGPKRVGWWSGALYRKDPPLPPPTQLRVEEEEEEEDGSTTTTSNDTNSIRRMIEQDGESSFCQLDDSNIEAQGNSLTSVVNTSNQSSMTAKHANFHIPDPMSDTSTDEGDDDNCGANMEGDRMASILDTSLVPSEPSSTLPSMFYDDDDSSTLLSLPHDLEDSEQPSVSYSNFLYPQQEAEEPLLPTTSTATPQVELSAVTSPDTLRRLANENRTLSVSKSTTASNSKYQEYMKYLEEVGSARRLISNPFQRNSGSNNSPNSSLDSDDLLLDGILADDSIELASPPPSCSMTTTTTTTTTAVIDNRYLTAGSNPTSLTLLRVPPQKLQSLDLSFPDRGANDDFLFEEYKDNADTKEKDYAHQQEEARRSPNPTTTMMSSEISQEPPASPASLPHSKFSSNAASRKRLLESYVRDFINNNGGLSRLTTPTSAVVADGDVGDADVLVTDDSELLWDDARGIVIRPEDTPFTSHPEEITEAPPSPTSTVSGNSIGQNDGSSTTRNSEEKGSSPSKQRQREQDNPNPDDDEDSLNEDNEDFEMKMEIPETLTPPTDHSTSTLDAHEHDREGQMDCLGTSCTSALKTRQLEDFHRAQAAWLQDRRQAQRCLNRIRGTLVVACTLLVMGTLLGALNGAWALDWQRQGMVNAWSDLQATALELQALLQELQTLQSAIGQQLWNLWQLLDQHCPLIRGSVCPTAYTPTTASNMTCNLTGIPLQESWESWLAAYVDPQTLDATLFDAEEWNAVSTDLEALADQPVDIALDGWNWALWAAVGCNILLSLFALSILTAISLPEARRLHYQLSTWWFATVYWVSCTLAWIFACCFFIGTTLTVDTCTSAIEDAAGGAPATIAKTLMNRIDTRSFLPAYWDYVVDGCPAESYPMFLSDRVTAWSNYLPTSFRIANDLEQHTDLDFLATCGTPIAPLRDAAGTLSVHLCMVTQSLVNVRRILGCDKWYPWYDSMVNESICYQGSTAFLWCSLSQILILVMAFLIWTLRVSFTSLRPTNAQPFKCRNKVTSNSQSWEPKIREQDVVELV